MKAITAPIIPLVAGIAIGFAILPLPGCSREQALDAYVCGEIADYERVQRDIFHNRDAVPLPQCDTAQRHTEAYLCGEIAYEEWVQRKIFDDRDAVLLPECRSLQRLAEEHDEGPGTVAGPQSGRLHNLLARFFGRPEVGSFDQPESLASTP
jgi:hypothetical protein